MCETEIYLHMWITFMRKNKTYILMTVICIGIILVLFAQDLHKTKAIGNIEIEKEELQRKYEMLQAEHTKLNDQLEEKETYSQELEKKINFWEENRPEGWQPFHGWWVADIYYLPNDSTEYECRKGIEIYNYVIRMSGDDLTDKPIYNVAARIKGDIVENIKNLGITNENLLNLLQADCYAEIDISMTYEWNRKLLSREVDLIQNVKYYPITNDVMICVSDNDGGRVYILNRIGY